MKIIRHKEKKDLTPEEKELAELKKARNIGIASSALGLGALVGSRIPHNKSEHPNLNISNPKGKEKLLKVGGIGLAGSGAALGTVGEIKYRKLKKKLQKEKEENDNPEK